MTKNKINETTVEIQPVVINTRTDNNTALHAKSPVITNLAASRFVKWTSPEDPNGPVLRYQIDYKDVTNNGVSFLFLILILFGFSSNPLMKFEKILKYVFNIASK